MVWLEMSRDPEHGGRGWEFTRCLWSPAYKNDLKSHWPYWDSLLQVKAGDTVLHLRGKQTAARFVGFSVAAGGGYATEEKPPKPGVWAYADVFHRVELTGFTQFSDPPTLLSVFRDKAGRCGTISRPTRLPAAHTFTCSM